MILLIGSEGSMGKRYQAILRYLKKDFYCRDQYIDDIEDEEMMKQEVSGIIIATPTDTHAEIIREMIPYKKPILCEKPICKNLSELKELFEEIEEARILFHMMYQYRNIAPSVTRGGSLYDYFRHGNDGLYWDCIQIIGLAKDLLVLKEESPIWTCQINGYPLNLRHMDQAYITSVEKWLSGKPQDLGEILAMHDKVKDVMRVH